MLLSMYKLFKNVSFLFVHRFNEGKWLNKAFNEPGSCVQDGKYHLILFSREGDLYFNFNINAYILITYLALYSK